MGFFVFAETTTKPDPWVAEGSLEAVDFPGVLFKLLVHPTYAYLLSQRSGNRLNNERDSPVGFASTSNDC